MNVQYYFVSDSKKLSELSRLHKLYLETEDDEEKEKLLVALIELKSVLLLSENYEKEREEERFIALLNEF